MPGADSDDAQCRRRGAGGALQIATKTASATLPRRAGDRPATSGQRRATALGGAMSMKTILVPTEPHELMNSTLQTAVLLARKFDSYIEGFALSPAMVELFALDLGGPLPIEVKENDAEMARQARGLFEKFMSDRGVARSSKVDGSLSFGWLDAVPEGEGFVGSYGRVFDVIVLGRPDAGRSRASITAVEAGLFETGRPVLIAPPSPPQQLGENILIAWNCSTEQARVTGIAMPLLQKAGRVTVLTVEGGTVPGPSGEQLARYLRRNGVECEPVTVTPAGRSTGETILAQAASRGCDLLIKGAYTQSRLRQMIFGGATRHILANASLPVLMAH
jgi:nucleotide-binding universal stress UspA family protein